MSDFSREDEVKSRKMYIIDSQYRRIRTLGKGNFGKVYLAEHRQTLQQVAIKAVDKRNFKNEDQKIHAMNEKNISHDFAMRLHHKNVVEVYDVKTDDDFIYIIMEYLSGGELFDKIKEKGRLDEHVAKRWFREIVEAVKYIHDNGIVHRDLKPENVLLDKNEHIRICDFGFGKVCDDQQLLTTYCGSPFYAAPEMVTATPYTGPKVDIWSCGVILFAMISGKLPFQCENMPDLFKKISIGAYNVPHSIKASPAALIARMLCVKPGDRASAQDILDHAWLSGTYTDTTPVANPALLRLPPTLTQAGTEENEPSVREEKPDIIPKAIDAQPVSGNRGALQAIKPQQTNTETVVQPITGVSKEILSKENHAGKAKRKWFLSGKRMQVAPLKTNIIIGNEAAKKLKEADNKLFDRLRVLFKSPKKTLTAQLSYSIGLHSSLPVSMLRCYSQSVVVARRSLHTGRNVNSIWAWGLKTSLPPIGSAGEALLRPKLLTEIPGIEKSDKIIKIATGWGHSLISAVGEQRTKVCSYGLNRSGQLGIGNQTLNSTDFGVSMQVGSGTEIKFLAAGREHSHIVTSDMTGQTHLYSFGNNMYGQLGTGKSKHDSQTAEQVYESKPVRVDQFEGNITQISCGLDNTVFATDANQVYAMGWGPDGQLGLGPDSSSDKSNPTLIPIMKGKKVLKLSSTTDFSLVLTNNGELWTWGNSEYGQGMLAQKIDRILEPLQTNVTGVKDIAAGGPFSIILKENGTVYSCGYAALGLGENTIETLEPKLVPFDEEVTKIFATQDMAAALTATGQLYTWGLGGHTGRLGLGHMNHSFVPQKVQFDGAPLSVIDLSLGTSHALCLCTE